MHPVHPVQMGVYYRTVVYRGRLLSAESVRRLESRRASDVTAPLLADLGARGGLRILHAPGALVTLGVLDPILDDGDVRAGVVTWDQLRHACRARPGILDPIERELSPEEDALLLDCLRSAAPSGAPDPAPGVYICEIETCVDGVLRCRVTKNIRTTCSLGGAGRGGPGGPLPAGPEQKLDQNDGALPTDP